MNRGLATVLTVSHCPFRLAAVFLLRCRFWTPDACAIVEGLRVLSGQTSWSLAGFQLPVAFKGAYSTFFSRSDNQTFTRLAATNELNQRNRKRSTEAADGTGLLPTASKATLCFFQGTVTQTVNFKPSKTAALRRYLGLAARMRKQRRSLPR